MSWGWDAQDPDSFAKGKALFQDGLLSEAVLALEAEVQRQPNNVEAWRLLGTVHAENDDDQQVSAKHLLPLPFTDCFSRPIALRHRRAFHAKWCVTR